MNEKMPSPEELNRIQKENLTDEQIERDKEREDAFEAGKKHEINIGYKAVLRDIKEAGIKEGDEIRIFFAGLDGIEQTGRPIRGYFKQINEDALVYTEKPLDSTTNTTKEIKLDHAYAVRKG